MKMLIKLIFWTLGLVLILVIAVVVAVATLDPNSHKDWIADKVREGTGRSLALNGAITLSWYPWLGLEVNDLTLGNAPGFGNEPFFHTDFAKFRIKLLPLFQQQYLVDTIQFHGTVINLSKNKDGVTNWADLAGEQQQQRTIPLTSLILGGVDIKDARLSWTDAGTDSRMQLSKVNLKVGELVYGRPIDLSLGLDIASSKPALSGDAALSGTLLYDQDNKTVKVQPLDFNARLNGKNIPGGRTEITLATVVNVDLDKDVITIPEFSLSGLSTSASGELEARNMQSAKPMVKTRLQVAGEDLSLLFKVAEIEPLASQIAGLANRRFSLDTSIDADLERGDVDVSKLSADLLDATIRGEVKARNIQSSTPSFKGRMNASGPDFPTLLQVVGQFETGDRPVLGNYGKQLSNIPQQQKSFEINTRFDADLKTGDIDIPEIAVKGLGFTVNGGLTASDMQSNNGAVQGDLTVTGTNLAAVLAAFDQQAAAEVLRDFNVKSTISGNRNNIQLKPMALKAIFAGKQIPDSPATLVLDADTRIDLEAHQLSLDNLNATGLGLNLKGKIKAGNLQSDTPRIQGDINATGEDLPVLMELLGRFQTGKDPALLDYGKRFGGLPQDYKKFRLATSFDMDKKSGNLSVPELAFNGLGLNVTGNMRSTNLQDPKGSVNGNIDITGRGLGPVLMALDYQALAGSIQEVHIQTGVNGDRKNLNLRPLALTATVVNDKTSAAPVNLSLNADTNVNLDAEQLRLDQFSLKGLGLDAKGSITASKILQTPEFSGTLDVAPFNMRGVMTKLNMEVPVTADKQVLTRVALAARFSGSTTNVNMEDLKLVLDDTTLLGRLSITDFDKPATAFAVTIDKINADRYLKPADDNKKQKPVTPQTAAIAATQLPVETLRSLNTSGSLKVGELVISKIRMTNLDLVIEGKDGEIVLDPVAAELYRGYHTGNIKLNATGKVPRLTINTSLKQVQLEPLLADFMGKADLTGSADLSIAAITAGGDTDTLKRSLNGQGEAHIRDGILRGIDIRKVLEQVEIMIEDKTMRSIDRGKETIFDKFDLRFNMNNGVARSEEFLMTSPGIKVTGEGVLADLHADAILYKMNVAVDESTATRNEERYNLGGYSLPVKCQGKLAAPDCQPEYASIVRTVIQKSLVEKLLKNKGDSSGQTQEQATTGQQQTQQQPQQQVDPGKELLNKALEQILKRK